MLVNEFVGKQVEIYFTYNRPYCSMKGIILKFDEVGILLQHDRYVDFIPYTSILTMYTLEE